MMENKNITYFKFLSEIRAFLSKLLKDPISAKPNKPLTKYGLSKKALIKVLMDRNILERHEKIKDSTNSDETTPKYVVSYKVRKKDFEKRIMRIYQKYVEKNTPKKDKLNECECGCCGDNVGSFSVPVFGLQSRSIYPVKGEKSKKRKTKTNENMSPKKIYITEEQFNYIQSVLSENNAGDVMLQECGDCGGATSTMSVGGQYEAIPAPVQPNDPSLKRNDGKGGSTSTPKKRVGEK